MFRNIIKLKTRHTRIFCYQWEITKIVFEELNESVVKPARPENIFFRCDRAALTLAWDFYHLVFQQNHPLGSWIPREILEFDGQPAYSPNARKQFFSSSSWKKKLGICTLLVVHVFIHSVSYKLVLTVIFLLMLEKAIIVILRTINY